MKIELKPGETVHDWIRDRRLDPASDVTLIAVSRSTGNGYIAEYGYLKEFGFDLPTALRRLAKRIEESRPKGSPPG